MARKLDAALTSLGVPLEERAGLLALDLSHLRLFKGLSVIARMIADDVLERLRSDPFDIISNQRVIAGITPELAGLVSNVVVHARSGVFSAPLEEVELTLPVQLRTVFGTLQRPRWGSILFPELFGARQSRRQPRRSDSEALLFSFGTDTRAPYFFFVERDADGNFLRISIDRLGAACRLNLSGIPHSIVDDLERRHYLQGLTRITESVYQGILRECENQRLEYDDNARRNSHFFRQLAGVGLTETDSLSVRWPADASEFLVRSSAGEVRDFLKRVFIVLEDAQIVQQLQSEATVCMTAGGRSAYIDLSRRQRCLNVSLEERRSARDLDYYLARMPQLAAVGCGRARSLKGTRVFLIHHITGEILGTLQALENMGATRISVLFVKYAGVVPPEYLETLLTLPEDQYRFNGLQKVDSADQIDPYYLLSRQYSDPADLAELSAALTNQRLPFYEAMQLAAGHLFFREALAARAAGERLLLVEDGGYLAPLLNHECLAGASLSDLLRRFGVPNSLWPSARELRQKAAKWLAEILPGTVEHTRNGYNRLLDVQAEHGRLSFPAGSIAISQIKRERESAEVSISILHAIESILHGLGLVFSERRALVLGSRGAIGRNLMEDLSAKLLPRNVLGVDIVLESEKSPGPWQERARLRDLPADELANVDMVVGVIGQSIFERRQLEALVLHSQRDAIFFASGSTKTAEFTHLSEWVSGLHRQAAKLSKHKKAGKDRAAPRIGGVLLADIQAEPVRDPQTEHIVATRVRLRFATDAHTPRELRGLDGRVRDLYLLGGLTPINFLFYGVPTETMDAILAQLLTVAAGVARHEHTAATKLPPKLLAVDREIDADARPL